MGDNTAQQYSTPRRAWTHHVRYQLDDDDDNDDENDDYDNDLGVGAINSPNSDMEQDYEYEDEDVDIEYQDEVSPYANLHCRVELTSPALAETGSE